MKISSIWKKLKTFSALLRVCALVCFHFFFGLTRYIVAKSASSSRKVEDLKLILEEKNVEISSLQEKIEQVGAENKTIQEQRGQSHSEMERFKEKIEGKFRDLYTSEKNIVKDLRKKNAIMNRELDSKASEIQGLEKKVNSSSTDCDLLNQKVLTFFISFFFVVPFITEFIVQ